MCLDCTELNSTVSEVDRHLVLHIDQVNGKQKLEWNSFECNNSQSRC